MTTNKDIRIDKYIAGFPEEVQSILHKIRDTIQKAAPDAEESFGYGVPAFKFNNKFLVYFAAFKKHVGIYPVPKGNEGFQLEAKKYQTGKGTFQFPLDKPVPYDFITEIVKFRINEL